MTNPTITMDCEELLKRLKANRAKHEQTFKKARKRYRHRMIRELHRAAEIIQDGGNVNLRKVTMLPEPRHYLDEYDTVIAMVEWHTEPTFTLDQGAFEQYVLDKWSWKGAFVAGTQLYV